MKPTNARRYRRRSTSSKSETNFFKKESQESFFGGAEHETFFQPATVSVPSISAQRKCAECEDEENVQRAPEKKEEEKKVMKKDDKKEEEKKIAKKEDKKEEEKKVVKKEDKKEDEKKVQKKEDKKEEKKEEDKKVMKKEEKKEEEKKVQKKDGRTNGSVGAVSNYISTLSGKGQPLPAAANYFFSSKMGYDFSNVKLHNDKKAAESAKNINAKAYTIGNNVVFNEGQYNIESAEGKKLMAHELTHVVQQNGNEVKREVEAEPPEPEMVLEPTPTFSSQEMMFDNTTHYADCNGVSVQGRTDANYGHSFSAPGSSTPGQKFCGKKCSKEDCVINTGTVDSVFTANPQITLPPVPSGLNDCEQGAVQNFIDTTLLAHEQLHEAAFNTYVGTVSTPYTYKGCASGLDAHTKKIHDDLQKARKTAADAKSAALDKGGKNKFTVKCDCPDPKK